MDYNGRTPAQLYAEEVKYFYQEKDRLTTIVDTERDRRSAVTAVCTHDYPDETLKAIQKEAQEARARLSSIEFTDQERMLVLLSPLYEENEGVTE